MQEPCMDEILRLPSCPRVVERECRSCHPATLSVHSACIRDGHRTRSRDEGVPGMNMAMTMFITSCGSARTMRSRSPAGLIAKESIPSRHQSAFHCVETCGGTGLYDYDHMKLSPRMYCSPLFHTVSHHAERRIWFMCWNTTPQ